MLLRFITYGPLAGALVGTAQTLAAVKVWLAHGQPDFYFLHGQAGVEFHLIMMIVGGSFAGLLFGLFLELFEDFAHRRIRLAAFLPLLLSAAFAASLATVAVEFRRGELFAFPLGPQVFAVLFSLLVVPLVSRPVAPKRPDTPASQPEPR